jgi:regulator of sigma E protease
VNVFVAILGLAFLILIHEAGHFVTALAVGMRPKRFYVGFPPAIAKTTRNGIEYGLGAIPLGGFVKIPGMHRPAASDVDAQFGRILREAPELVGPVERVRRVLQNGGDYPGDAREEIEDLRAAIEAAKLSDDAKAAALRSTEEISDSLSREAYWRQPTWKRVAVIFAGPATNLLLAVALFTVLYMLGGGRATATVDEVLPGRPAATAGLRAGDTIREINRRPVKARDIPPTIQASKGEPITVTVERGPQRIVLGPIRAKKEDGVYRLGFRLRGEHLNLPEAAWQSVKLTGIVTREIGKSLARLVQRGGQKEVASPVGIVQGSSNALNEGFRAYLGVLGLISLSLALMNLLPLLPLDGGHIAFSLVERIRGRAVGRSVYERVSAVGIALVLLLFFIGLSNDIGNLGGG